MEGLRTFLENSTVHGLNYISTTRKHTRFFWIFVVVSGFLTAGYLIHQSFQTWAESPVKTTVETLPITEITFPKITVCPPRNTHTGLNYDLMSINVTLTEYADNNSTESSEIEYDIFGVPIVELRKTKNDKLLDIALDVTKYQTYMDDLMKLEEENRFFNWYHGITKISEPKYKLWDSYEYSIDTSALSGVIKTRHFGERFNDHLSLERDIRFEFIIHIYPPEKTKYNSNVTLNIKLERVSIKGLSELITEGISVAGKSVDDDETIFKFKSPDNRLRVNSIIQVPKSVDLGRAKKMPGFRVSWWYTGADIVPYRKFADNRYTQDLRR